VPAFAHMHAPTRRRTKVERFALKFGSPELAAQFREAFDAARAAAGPDAGADHAPASVGEAGSPPFTFRAQD